MMLSQAQHLIYAKLDDSLLVNTDVGINWYQRLLLMFVSATCNLGDVWVMTRLSEIARSVPFNMQILMTRCLCTLAFLQLYSDRI